MVWALVLARLFCALFAPHIAYAEEVEEKQPQQVVVDNSGLKEDLQKIDQDLIVRLDAVNRKLDVMNNVENSDENPELDQLISIDEHLTQIVGENTSAGLMAQEPLRASGSATFTAYANVSPTGQWATYAESLLPKVAWDEHYVFLQDTSSSYVMVYGDLEVTNNGEISGTGKWVRWYYSGTATGYRVDTGNGNVGIYANSLTILSDLGDYPILGDGSDGLRREVMYYALVAVAVFSLYHVWHFCIRTAQSFKGVG